MPLVGKLGVDFALTLDPCHEALAVALSDCICYSHEALSLDLH